MLAEEAPRREIHIFGRDTHALAGPGAQSRRDIVEIGHRAHIDPGARHGDDDIGLAEEAERSKKRELARRLWHGLMHEIGARRRPRCAPPLASWVVISEAERNEDPRCSRRLRNRRDNRANPPSSQRGASRRAREEESVGALFAAGLSTERRRRAGSRRLRRARAWHHALRLGRDTIEPDRAADRRHLLRGAEPAQQAVVAPTPDERLGIGELRIPDLEDETRIVIEVAAEAGREAQARKIDAACLHEAVSDIERCFSMARPMSSSASAASARSAFRGLVRVARDREEALERIFNCSSERPESSVRRLFEEACRDLMGRAAADRRDACDLREYPQRKAVPPRGLALGGRRAIPHRSREAPGEPSAASARVPTLPARIGSAQAPCDRAGEAQRVEERAQQTDVPDQRGDRAGGTSRARLRARGGRRISASAACSILASSRNPRRRFAKIHRLHRPGNETPGRDTHKRLCAACRGAPNASGKPVSCIRAAGTALAPRHPRSRTCAGADPLPRARGRRLERLRTPAVRPARSHGARRTARRASFRRLEGVGAAGVMPLSYGGGVPGARPRRQRVDRAEALVSEFGKLILRVSGRRS